MISNDIWRHLLGYTQDKLLSMYDPSLLHPSAENIREKLNEPHKGFYIGLEDAQGLIVREGFLKEGLSNALDSTDMVVSAMFNRLRSESVEADRVRMAQFHLVLVSDVIYLPDPLRWDQSKDGVYFQWGQDYRGLYLPFQIAKMNISQVDIMDRLCQDESGLAANLWRLPEGLCFSLRCLSYSS